MYLVGEKKCILLQQWYIMNSAGALTSSQVQYKQLAQRFVYNL